MAESSPSIQRFFNSLNDRFREKRTLHCCFRNAQINAKYLSVQMTALPSKADIELESVGRAAYDCDFNRSMQHLVSKYREEDVVYEAATEKIFHWG